MKNFSYTKNVIIFFKKKITLSFLILLNLAAYSNPIDENTERKADYNFLSGKSLFTSFDHYIKNNVPEEASHTAPVTANNNQCRWSATVSAEAARWLSIPAEQTLAGSKNLDYSYVRNTSTTARTGTITVAGQIYTVRQAGVECAFTLASNTADVPATTGRGSVLVRSKGSAGCTWSAAVNKEAETWLAVEEQSKSDIENTLIYSYRENPSANPRTGTITVAGQTYTVKQAGVECAFTLASNTADVPATEGRGSVLVRSKGSAGCTWSAAVNKEAETWLAVEEQSNIENTLIYSYKENPNANPRTGTITVAGQTYTVRQAGVECAFTLASNTADVPATEGRGSVLVRSKGSARCTWSAAVNKEAETWLAIEDQSNIENTLIYSYRENPSANPREGTITVAGQTYTVKQAGVECAFTLASNTADVPATAGMGSVLVRSNGSAGCTWSAAVNKEAETWLAVEEQNNIENTLIYSYRENPTGNPREEKITVGGQILTVRQEGAICVFSLASTTADVPATEGRGSVLVRSKSSAGCTWSAAVNKEAETWLAVEEQSKSDIENTLMYSYKENPTGNPREGRITVAGQILTVRQEGAICVFSLASTTADVPATEGRGSVLVRSKSSAGCTWSAAVNKEAETWLAVEEQSKSDIENTLMYSYKENPTGNPREGRITVAGLTYTVIQAGACVYTLSQGKTEIGAAASTAETRGSFSVTVQGTDCSWSWMPATTDKWITNLTKAANADGSWTVSYSYTANTTTTERVGRITVADKTYTLAQDSPCSYTLDPPVAFIRATASTTETTESFLVTAQGPNCPCTPIVIDDWITNVTKTQTADGTWTITYSYTANPTTTEREGRIIVADKTHIVIQDPHCSWTLLSTETHIGAAASTESFWVSVRGNGCSWTPVTTDKWITNVTKTHTVDGLWAVTYSCMANTSTSERRGTITMADRTYTVIQAEAVNLPSFYSTTADVPATAGKGSLEQTFTVSQSAEKEAKMGIEPISSVRIFPNPAKDFVTVDLSESSIKYVSLKIVNQVGQILYKVDSPPTQTLEIPLNGFTSGLYFILLQGRDKVWVEKLIVK